MSIQCDLCDLGQNVSSRSATRLRLWVRREGSLIDKGQDSAQSCSFANLYSVTRLTGGCSPVHRCLKRVDAVEKVGRESRWALAVCLNLGSVDLQFLTILLGDMSLAAEITKGRRA